jgi:hypothetical protein
VSELTSTFNAAPDGVLTAEAGVISGELELRTVLGDDGALSLTIRYAGAAEWYSLPGTGHRLHDARDHDTLHRVLVDVLRRPVAA